MMDSTSVEDSFFPSNVNNFLLSKRHWRVKCNKLSMLIPNMEYRGPHSGIRRLTAIGITDSVADEYNFLICFFCSFVSARCLQNVERKRQAKRRYYEVAL